MRKITNGSGRGQAETIGTVKQALRLAREVGPVFPCDPASKRPLTEHGFHDASTDENQIRYWWARDPNALIGVPTGKASGLCAIDCDPKAADWYQENRKRLGEHRLHTTRRGKHLLYQYVDGVKNSTGEIAPGVDVRGEGGYIVWWPAHGGVGVGEPGELPDWLLERVLNKKPRVRKLNGHHDEPECDWSVERPRVFAALSQLDPGCGHDDWRDIGMALSWATGGAEEGCDLYVKWSRGDLSIGGCPDNFKSEREVRSKYASFANTKDENITLATIYRRLLDQGDKVPAGRSNTHKKLRFDRDKVEALSFESLRRIRNKELTDKRCYIGEWLYPGAWLAVGRPKIGKSWLLLQLLLSWAKDRAFLGFPVDIREGEGALAVFAEDDDIRIAERATLLAGAPRNVQVINREKFLQLAKRFSAQGDFAGWLDVWLTGHPNIKLIVIDTETSTRFIWGAGKPATTTAKRVTEVDYEQTARFDEIALRHGVVIFLVNHASKLRLRTGETFDVHEIINRTNTALAGASGSFVLADMPDADRLDPSAKSRILGVRGRDVKEDVLLSIRQGGSTGEDPRFMNEGPYHEVKGTHVQQEILTELQNWTENGDIDSQEFVTAKELAASLGKSYGAVKRAISRMLAAKITDWKEYRIIVRSGRAGGIRLKKRAGKVPV